jgi:hypothetical protein
MIVYHYSHGIRLAAILKSGVLLPTKIGVPRHEKPAVWFTTNDFWEPTTSVRVIDRNGRLIRRLSMRECHEMVGLIRFTVNEASAPYTWSHHKRNGGMDRSTAKSLYDTAIEMGSSPSQYRMSYVPVPASKWLAVENWDGASWQPIPDFVSTAA